MSDPTPVSCEPALYAEGGLYEDAPLSFPEEVSGRGTVAALYPSATYLRPVVPDRLSGSPAFIERLTNHYTWVNSVFPRMPAAALVRLGSCRIQDRAIQLRTGEEWHPLYETRRHSDRPYLRDTSSDVPTETLPTDVDYLHLDSAGSFNYGHFLVDDLSRMRALDLMPRRPGRPLGILMTSHGETIDSLRKTAILALAGSDRDVRVRWLSRDKAYEVDSLHYPSPVTVHPALKQPGAMEDLASRAVAAAGRAGIARPGRGRGLANWPEIAPVLRRHHLRVVDPESLGFLDQVAHLADAELVVGPMGASMTNTVFSRPGARVLHLAPEGWLEPFFWDLAAVRGHHYAACYGQPGSAETPHLADFTIAPADLELALASIA